MSASLENQKFSIHIHFHPCVALYDVPLNTNKSSLTCTLRGENHRTFTEISLFGHGKTKTMLRNVMNWKTEGETGSGMQFTIHLKTAAMKVHDALGNCQAEAKAGWRS